MINSVTIAIDGTDTFEIKGIALKRILVNTPEAEKLKIQRDEVEVQYFSSSNRPEYLLEIDLFKVQEYPYFLYIEIQVVLPYFQVVFPYEHDYAEAIQNQFLSIIKWLKIIHTKDKDETTERKSDKKDRDFDEINDKPALTADWLINVSISVFIKFIGIFLYLFDLFVSEKNRQADPMGFLPTRNE